MSFHEKSAWGSLVIVLLAFGGYAAAQFATGAADSPQATAALLLGVVVVVVVAEVGYHIVIALPLVRHPEDGEADERDRLVARRAESSGGLILGCFVVVAIGDIVIREAFFPADRGLQSAHLLLAGLVLAEVVTDIYRIVLYRRGV